jgi:hypothetical protein
VPQLQKAEAAAEELTSSLPPASVHKQPIIRTTKLRTSFQSDSPEPSSLSNFIRAETLLQPPISSARPRGCKVVKISSRNSAAGIAATFIAAIMIID